MASFNLHAAEFTFDPKDPPGYRAGMARFGPDIGATLLGGTVYELPPGQSICPYHFEYGDEEWLIVLDGRPTLRRPQGEEDLGAGDVVCLPAGPEGAHKVTNRTVEHCHVLMLSTRNDPAVVGYPDSGKVGVYPGNGHGDLLFRREDAVDYYDGEPRQG
jgi:uncharacterized cupin superfamily protein